jgi:hypothetical protein
MSDRITDDSLVANHPAPRTLLKADAVTLVIKAERDGHLRLTASAWEDARVILPGQSVELRIDHGQVAVILEKLKSAGQGHKRATLKHQ